MPGRRRQMLCAALRLLTIAWMAAGCGDGERPPTTQTPLRPARPTLRIVAMTDPSGYLEPCGCQSRPLGGVDKAAARLRELRADGAPTLLVAAGNLFFAGAAHREPGLDGAHDDAAQQARWQAEALAKVFAQLELVAAVPGPADREHGADVIRELGGMTRAPLLGGGEADTLLIERDGVQVGVWGLSDVTADLPARAKLLTAELRERGAAIVIGLLQADARAARRVAGASAGLDVLVLGGLDTADVPPPERVGTATLVRAAHHGQGLLVLELFRDGEGAFEDVSAWTRDAHEQTATRAAADLAQRIDAWRSDPDVDPQLLAEQEARLLRLRDELRAHDEPARVTGNTLAARFVELGPEAPSDAGTRALIEAHDARVNAHNRIALADLRPKPVAAGAPGYVGSERCGTCHAPALSWWRGHAHGRAYATLEQRNKQFNLSCVGCHVTGYNQPGGATVVHNQGLTDVGCESCHGPGSLHVQDQDIDAAKNVTRQVAEAACKQCHNPEHSDRFAYDAYRAMLIAPGHGLPARAPK